MSETETKSDAPGVAARRAALELTTLVRKGQSLDEALENCRDFNALAGPDRAFARAIASTALRRYGAIEFILGDYIDRPLPRKAARVMEILRLTAAQLLYLETPPHAAVSVAVELAGERRETAGYSKLVNAIARKIGEHAEKLRAKAPLRADTPGWLWRSWERAYGAATTRLIAEAHRAPAPLDLTLKPGVDVAAASEKIGAIATPAGGLRLAAPPPVREIAGYDDGDWWVQDLAASLPARLLGDVAGMHVLDLCAAPGGKTLQLAAAGAIVTAVDIAGARLKIVAENLARTKLQAQTVSANIIEWRPAALADAVLLDAPCSATGTIRRHPELPWSREEGALKPLAAQQARMIDAAADMVKAGGLLVYCVCSLQREEGEAQAKAFLERRGEFERIAVTAGEIGGLAEAINRDGDLRTLPSMRAEIGGMDGFFAARFKKAS